jgi:hypothetical protein
MGTTLLFIHGRGAESPPGIADDDARLREYIGTMKRGWLAGLSRGLVLARADPVGDDDVVFPFYADHVRHRIEEYESNGGRRPELEIMTTDDAQEKRLVEAKSAALLDAANAIGFDPATELGYADRELGRQAAGRIPVAGPDGSDALRIPVLRSALRFLGRKTGVPTIVIEGFLTDLAYYLEFDGMRRAVLTIVEDSLRERSPGGDGGRVVVVGHGLGGVVAYDLLTRFCDDVDVRLLVTAGSPLGYPIVQNNLLGRENNRRPRVPDRVPARQAAWVNAYDVRDLVSLVHPIGGGYDCAVANQIVDRRTFNPTCPHSIADYLADPDVSGPIGRATREE